MSGVALKDNNDIEQRSLRSSSSVKSNFLEFKEKMKNGSVSHEGQKVPSTKRAGTGTFKKNIKKEMNKMISKNISNESVGQESVGSESEQASQGTLEGEEKPVSNPDKELSQNDEFSDYIYIRSQLEPRVLVIEKAGENCDDLVSDGDVSDTDASFDADISENDDDNILSESEPEQEQDAKGPEVTQETKETEPEPVEEAKEETQIAEAEPEPKGEPEDSKNEPKEAEKEHKEDITNMVPESTNRFASSWTKPSLEEMITTINKRPTPAFDPSFESLSQDLFIKDVRDLDDERIYFNHKQLSQTQETSTISDMVKYTDWTHNPAPLHPEVKTSSQIEADLNLELTRAALESIELKPYEEYEIDDADDDLDNVSIYVDASAEEYFPPAELEAELEFKRSQFDQEVYLFVTEKMEQLEQEKYQLNISGESSHDYMDKYQRKRLYFNAKSHTSVKNHSRRWYFK